MAGCASALSLTAVCRETVSNPSLPDASNQSKSSRGRHNACHPQIDSYGYLGSYKDAGVRRSPPHSNSLSILQYGSSGFKSIDRREASSTPYSQGVRLVRCGALTIRLVQCRRGAVQVLLRSRDADLRHTISVLQGLHYRADLPSHLSSGLLPHGYMSSGFRDHHEKLTGGLKFRASPASAAGSGDRRLMLLSSTRSESCLLALTRKPATQQTAAVCSTAGSRPVIQVDRFLNA